MKYKREISKKIRIPHSLEGFYMEQVYDTNKVLLKNCSLVKTFLMLLVLLGHACLFWGGAWARPLSPIFSCPLLGKLAIWLASFHIYSFVLVSGYIFYYVKYERNDEKYWSIKKYLHTKYKRLLIPYITISALWVVPLSLFVGVFNQSTDLTVNFIFGKSPSQLWFLLMLFGVFMVSYFFADFWKKFGWLGLVTTIIFYVLGLFGGKMGANYFQGFTSFSYLVFFFIGFKIRQNLFLMQNLMRIPVLLWVVIDMLLFAVMQYESSFESLCVSKSTILLFYKIILPFFLHVWGAVGSFVVLQKLFILVPIIGKIFYPISKFTMPVYLLHQQIIYILIYYLNGLVNPYLNAAANFILSLMISVMISFILMRFRLTRIIIGEKG